LGGKCKDYRVIRNKCSSLFGKPEKNKHFEDINNGRRIILNYIIEKLYAEKLSEFNWLIFFSRDLLLWI
jgi:hypothetical protein